MLSDPALKALTEVSVRRAVRSGQCLWKMGDPADFVGVILSGCFEVTRLSPAGTETCMAVFGQADVIGMSAVLRKTAYPGTARAISQGSEVIKMYLRPIVQRNDPTLAQEIGDWLREMVLIHEQILRDKVDIVSAGRVEQKVFELLVQLNRRFGVRESRSRSRIPLKISKTQVSRLVDARVETVIRLLGQWKKKGLVYFDRTGILVSDWDEMAKWIERDKK